MITERKSFAIKQIDTANGGFIGLASTFGNVDRAGEVVDPGSFKNLDAFVKDGFIAVGHDWNSLPVGIAKSAIETLDGLQIEIEFHSTPEAQNARTVALERLAAGKSVSLSIGYRVLEDEWKDEVRHLKALELFEVSLVTVPANPRAVVSAAKSILSTELPFADHCECVSEAVKSLAERVDRLAELKKSEEKALSEKVTDSVRLVADHLEDSVKALRDVLPADETQASNALADEALRVKLKIRCGCGETRGSVDPAKSTQ